MPTLLAAFATSLVIGLAIERMGLRLPSAAGFAVRLGMHAALFAMVMAIGLRPWLAAAISIIVPAVLVTISEIKRRILAEPLTVTDFALVPQAIRHPALYYVDVVQKRPMQILVLLAAAGIAALIVAWIVAEPPLVIGAGPGTDRALWTGLACALAAAGLSPAFARFSTRQLRPAEFGRDEARHGLLASLVMTAAARNAQRRALPAARALARALPRPRPATEGPALVVAVQMESFVDIAGRGLNGARLDAFAALRRGAIAHGSVMLPYEGAYTMRTEFGFLTGLEGEPLGLHATDPYLSARHYCRHALPRLMGDAGYRTLFVHPYDGDFFGRRSVMPALGFAAALFEDAFADAARDGPYVSDAAVADRILAEARLSPSPLFIFAVTVEAHGPWQANRIAGVSGSEAHYRHHLENADRMIGRLMQALSDWPGGAVLCVYGDHAPARSLAIEIGDRRMTDFAIWDSRVPQSAPVAPRNMAIGEVCRTLLDHLRMRA